MKNRKIMEILGAYNAVKGNDTKLPVAVAWKRRLNISELEAKFKIIEDALKEINERYSDDEHSERDEKGNVKIKREYVEQWRNEQDELLEQETDVSIKKVSIDDLGNVNVSTADMETLAFMIGE